MGRPLVRTLIGPGWLLRRHMGPVGMGFEAEVWVQEISDLGPKSFEVRQLREQAVTLAVWPLTLP